jgi:hypothetical protein
MGERCGIGGGDADVARQGRISAVPELWAPPAWRGRSRMALARSRPDGAIHAGWSIDAVRFERRVTARRASTGCRETTGDRDGLARAVASILRDVFRCIVRWSEA